MKRFVDFYINSTGWNGVDFSGPTELIRMCGSDGYYQLDARRGLPYAHQQAKDRIGTLGRVRPHIKGYRIMEGNLRTNRPLTPLIELKGETK